MFLLLSLSRYLCWWNMSHRGYNPRSSQCFGGTNMASLDCFIVVIYYPFLNKIIIKRYNYLEDVNCKRNNSIDVLKSCKICKFES